MPQVIRRKLTDIETGLGITGGRSERWWRGRLVRRSPGSTDYPLGDINPWAVINKYKLKGFEYGNWLSQNDRYDRLMATRDSLHDLSRVVGSANLGFDGTLGIAFGARGTGGGGGAAAHFEPRLFMVNLTKQHGAGCLAHEYGHALDYFFGMYIDQNRLYSALSGGSSTARALKGNDGPLRRLMNAVLAAALNAPDGRQPSESYRRWQREYGAKSDYWFRRTEVFARTFEQWVANRCHQLRIKNPFLCHAKYDGNAYLTAADYRRAAPHMDRLVAEMARRMNAGK